MSFQFHLRDIIQKSHPSVVRVRIVMWCLFIDCVTVPLTRTPPSDDACLHNSTHNHSTFESFPPGELPTVALIIPIFYTPHAFGHLNSTNLCRIGFGVCDDVFQSSLLSRSGRPWWRSAPTGLLSSASVHNCVRQSRGRDISIRLAAFC